MKHFWSELTHLQLGRYAEHLSKMHFVLRGLDVFSSEVDDRGIDFIIRQEPDRYWDVQVKSSRNLNYVFLRKDKARIRPNLLLALVLFEDDKQPDLYLIPVSRWSTPDGLFVDRNYEGLSSKPEYGLNLSNKSLPSLQPFRFDTVAATLFSPASTV